MSRKTTRAARREKVIWRGSPKLEAFYGFYATGALFLLIAAAIAANLYFSPAAWGIVLPFCAAMFALPFVLRRAWRFAVTDRCVRSEFSLIAHRVLEAPIDNITDVVAFQGPMGRVFDFGEVRVCTAGSFFPGVTIWGVSEPFEIAMKIKKLLPGG